MLWLFGHEAYGILAPWLGIEPKFPTLEDEFFKKKFFFFNLFGCVVCQLWCSGLVTLWHVGSYSPHPQQGLNHVPCIERWILNYWTTTELQEGEFLTIGLPGKFLH